MYRFMVLEVRSPISWSGEDHALSENCRRILPFLFLACDDLLANFGISWLAAALALLCLCFGIFLVSLYLHMVTLVLTLLQCELILTNDICNDHMWRCHCVLFKQRNSTHNSYKLFFWNVLWNLFNSWASWEAQCYGLDIVPLTSGSYFPFWQPNCHPLKVFLSFFPFWIFLEVSFFVPYLFAVSLYASRDRTFLILAWDSLVSMNIWLGIFTDSALFFFFSIIPVRHMSDVQTPSSIVLSSQNSSHSFAPLCCIWHNLFWSILQFFNFLFSIFWSSYL